MTYCCKIFVVKLVIVVCIGNCLISMLVSVFIGHHNKELTYLLTARSLCDRAVGF